MLEVGSAVGVWLCLDVTWNPPGSLTDPELEGHLPSRDVFHGGSTQGLGVEGQTALGKDSQCLPASRMASVCQTGAGTCLCERSQCYDLKENRQPSREERTRRKRSGGHCCPPQTTGKCDLQSNPQPPSSCRDTILVAFEISREFLFLSR